MFDSNQEENNKPIVYFLTQDFFADHVQELIQELDKNNIPYVLQKEYDTLGKPLDNRYFVVVDNIKGTVKLGAQFSSLLMFIVGYPRKGENKKNHYCKKPQDVVAKYKSFLGLPEFEKTIFSTSAIKSKSNLKTIKSIPRSKASSQLIHNKSRSVSSQSINNSLKPRTITNIDDNNKVYMILSQKISENQKQNDFKQQKYNKYLLKIATSNPIKFKIIQNLRQLKINLQNSHAKNSHIVVNQNDFSLLQAENMSDKKFIVFLNPNDEQIRHKDIKLQKNVCYCKSHSSLVNEIRKVGFQAISLRDIDKSIIKYDNPFSKDKKNTEKATSKKIIWVDSQSKIQQSHESQALNYNLSQKLPNSQNKIGEASVKISAPCNLSNTYPKVNNQAQSETNRGNKLKVLEQLYAYNSETSKNTGQENAQFIKIGKKQSEKETVSISSKNSANMAQFQKATQVFLVGKNAPQDQNSQKEQKKLTKQNNQAKPSIKVINLEHKNKSKIILQNKYHKSDRNFQQYQIKVQQKNQTQLKGVSQKPATKSIRKIKRVKTETYERKIPEQQTTTQQIMKNAISQVKHIKRRLILPEQYYNPVSPASQASPEDRNQKGKENVENLKYTKRVLRSQSTEPSFSNIKSQQQTQPGYLLNAPFSKITLPKTAPQLVQKIYQSRKQIDNHYYINSQNSYYYTPKKVVLPRYNLPAYESGKKHSNEQVVFEGTYQKSNPSLHLFLQSKENINGSEFSTQKAIMQSRRESRDISVKTGQFNQMFTTFDTFGTTVCEAIQKVLGKTNDESTRFSFMQKDVKIQGINKIYNSNHSIEGFQRKSSGLSNSSQHESSFMRKTSSSLSQPISILWKQFNFDIQEGLVQLKKELRHFTIRDHSFFKADEIEKIIRNLPTNSKIIILLDEMDLDKFLYNLLTLIRLQKSNQQNEIMGEIVGIYIYQKQNQSFLSSSSLKFLDDPKSINKKFKEMLRSNNLIELQSLIKLVIQNDYDDVNKRVASEICSKVLPNNSTIAS